MWTWIVRRALIVLTFVAMVRWLDAVTRPAPSRCPTCPHRSPHREHQSNGHCRTGGPGLRVVP